MNATEDLSPVDLLPVAVLRRWLEVRICSWIRKVRARSCPIRCRHDASRGSWPPARMRMVGPTRRGRRHCPTPSGRPTSLRNSRWVSATPVSLHALITACQQLFRGKRCEISEGWLASPVRALLAQSRCLPLSLGSTASIKVQYLRCLMALTYDVSCCGKRVVVTRLMGIMLKLHGASKLGRFRVYRALGKGQRKNAKYFSSPFPWVNEVGSTPQFFARRVGI